MRKVEIPMIPNRARESLVVEMLDQLRQGVIADLDELVRRCVSFSREPIKDVAMPRLHELMAVLVAKLKNQLCDLLILGKLIKWFSFFAKRHVLFVFLDHFPQKVSGLARPGIVFALGKILSHAIESLEEIAA